MILSTKEKVRQLCLCRSCSRMFHKSRGQCKFMLVSAWVGLGDQPTSSLKSSQVIGVGSSFWRQCCKCSGSGRSRTRSKKSLINHCRCCLHFTFCCTIFLDTRHSDSFCSSLSWTHKVFGVWCFRPVPRNWCALLVVISSEHRWWTCGCFLQDTYTKHNKAIDRMKCHAVTLIIDYKTVTFILHLKPPLQ